MQRTSRLLARGPVNWGTMLAGVSTPESKHEVGELKAKFEECSHIVKSAPESVPALDLSRFKISAQATDIATYFEQEVSKIKIEQTDITAEAVKLANVELSKLKVEQDAAAIQLRADIAETEAKIALMEAKMTTRDTTADDLAATHPEFQKQWEEKHKNNEWAPGF